MELVETVLSSAWGRHRVKFVTVQCPCPVRSWLFIPQRRPGVHRGKAYPHTCDMRLKTLERGSVSLLQAGSDLAKFLQKFPGG